MAEEDNFDIDIYGDGGEDYQEEGQVHDQNQDGAEDTSMNDSNQAEQHEYHSYDEASHPAPDTSLPKPPIPAAQGGKRKDGPDERPLDPGATAALFVGELSWWHTDDEIRGWAKEANCEDELKDMTFNEQKVNGKSKGQVYLLFETPQAATAAKHKIDTYSDSGKYRTKFNVSYTNPLQNPFKTLPKDGPMRNQNRTTSGNFTSGHQPGFNPNYRGRGRGNFNAGGFNNRGGFQGGAGNFNSPMGGGGFQGGMNGMQQNYGGGGYGGGRGGMMGGRGGMGGMRGGRGGMQPNMGMSMPMPGGMMPNMPMGMPMGGGMNMPAGGFQGAYNPGFGYPQGGPGGDAGGWTGGPNKRPRQE